MNNDNNKILHIALLLLLISPPPAESFIITALVTAVSFAYQAYQVINDAHDTYKKFAPQTTLDDVLEQAKAVEAKVDQVGAQLSSQITQAVDTIITKIDDQNHIREGLTRLAAGIRRIDSLYRLFELYTSKKIRLNNVTLQNYINQVTTVGSASPKDILSDIYDLILPQHGLKRSLLFYLTKDSPKDDRNLCGSTFTSQSRLYQVFKLIMVAEIRVFTMLGFSYSLNQVFKCESFIGEIQLAEYELRSRAHEYYDKFSEILEVTASSIRTCDPQNGWLENENYYEFTRFKTDYVINSNAFYNGQGNCNKGCPENGGMITDLNCMPRYGCFHYSRCRGRIESCKAEKENSLEVCELSMEGRRYQYFNLGNDVTYGNSSGGCRGYLEPIKAKNGCDNCFCACVEDSHESYSIRTVSLRKQLSDVANNKVVTGIKFFMKNMMIHVMIQEGEVLPEGRIATGTAQWKDIEEIEFDSYYTYQSGALMFYIEYEDADEYQLEPLKDFVAFNSASYSIYLDDLILPRGYVVTGVRFNTPDSMKKEKLHPVHLEIQASPFDYESGKIMITDDNPSIWLNSGDMKGRMKEYDNERNKISLVNPAPPGHEGAVRYPQSTPNSEIELVSSATHTDGGQTTLPLLDGQEVVGDPPFAAGGAGLYYRAIDESDGGFIGFRLYGLDSMKNLQIEAIDHLDKYSDSVTEFKGCNDKISAS